MAVKRPLVLYSGQVQELDAGDSLYHADYLLTTLSPYAVGDLLYADSTTTLAKLADVAVGSYLKSGGIGVIPAWATLNQAAVAGLTTADGPTFAALHIYGDYIQVATSDYDGVSIGSVFVMGHLVPSGNTYADFRALTAGGSAAGNIVFNQFGGNIGIGTNAPTLSGSGRLHMAADTVRLDTARTPATAGAAGNAGEICWDSAYVYVCVATNSWKRAAIAAW